MNKESSKNKNMRNAFIRVSAVNHIHEDSEKLGVKAGDVVKYTKDDILDILDNWCKTKPFSYYMAEHNEEDNLHFHIVIEFRGNSQAKFLTIKSKLPFGHIDSCRHGVHACVRYLIHADNAEKHQYTWDDIITNNLGRLERYKQPTKYSEQIYVDKLVEQICSGAIREYELPDKIEPVLYVKYSTTFEKAFKLREKIVISNPNRNIIVCVLQGKSRVGKSTYVKSYAESLGKSVCLSSASNDAWQDYRGQDIFCYDDFNYKSTEIEDYLKALDPYNNTSIKARFHNRAFVGDAIFICTNIPITKWFTADAGDSHRDALFKRINYVLDFTEFDEEKNISYYTVNRIIRGDGYSAITDDNDIVTTSYENYKLEPIDKELRHFDLNKYIDMTNNEMKNEEFLNNISKL